MSAQQISTGSRVQRIASDYTDGRQGDVIEIDAIKDRARVNWTHEGPSFGSALFTKKLRTWVRFQDLREIG